MGLARVVAFFGGYFTGLVRFGAPGNGDGFCATATGIEMEQIHLIEYSERNATLILEQRGSEKDFFREQLIHV